MKTVVIDCAFMTSVQDAHSYLAGRLSFPDYYGGNLDALSDCLGDICEQTQLVIYRRGDAPEEMEQYVDRIIDVLRDACEENGRLTVSFDSVHQQ